MSALDLEILISIWTISITIAGTVARRLNKDYQEGREIHSGLAALVLLASLWIALLTVAIVYLLVRKAQAEPVVGWVLIGTCGVMVTIALVWGLIRSSRRRRASERAYLTPESSQGPPT
jgi:type VI protein secretion system component VasK